MANTLLLPDTTDLLEPSVAFPAALHFDVASGQLDAPGYPPMDFLASVVTPIYQFIKEEVPLTFALAPALALALALALLALALPAPTLALTLKP